MRGGLNLPNWELYHQASALKWLKEWVQLNNNRILTLEGYDLHTGWHSFLGGGKHTTHKYFVRHYVRKSLLTAWLKTKKMFYNCIPKWLSPIEAIIHPNFIKTENTPRYEQLLNDTNNLLNREELRDKGITLDQWHFLQLQSKYNSDKREFGFQDKITLDKILTGPDDQTISKIYSLILKEELREEEVKGNMIAWAQNTGQTIMLAEWEKIWTINYKYTPATSYRENIYKLFYRWHLPPARLAKMFPNLSPNCWKCGEAVGTYYHMWWTCPKAKKYWEKIKKILQEILDLSIKFKPELFLLGIFREKLNKEDRYLIINITTAARINWAREWKNKETPSLIQTINKILECAELSKLTFQIHDKRESDFYTAWEKWYNWLDRKKFIKHFKASDSTG